MILVRVYRRFLSLVAFFILIIMPPSCKTLGQATKTLVHLSFEELQFEHLVDQEGVVLGPHRHFVSSEGLYASLYALVQCLYQTCHQLFSGEVHGVSKLERCWLR